MMHDISYTGFIGYYLLLIILFACSYGVGLLYFSRVLYKKSFLVQSNVFIQLAEKLVFGVNIIICCIALFYTKGVTVQIITLFALIFLPLYTRKRNQIKYPIHIKINFSDFFIFFLITFALYTFHFYSSILPDFVFYAKLSQSLINAKNESVLSLYSSYGISQQMNLYHFGELWLNGFLAKVLGLNSLFSLKHIIYPFFHIIIFSVIYGLVRLKVANKYISILLSFALLYGSTILFYQIISPERGHYTFWFYGLPDITSFKTLIVYPFLLFALLYFREKKYEVFLFMFLICTIHFFTTWIAITGGLSLLLILAVIKKEYSHIWKILFSLICLCLVFLLPSLFYETNDSVGLIHHIYPISHYLTNAKEYVFRFFDYALRPIIFYPFVILGFLFYYKRYTNADKKVLLLILFCIISSVFFITFFYTIRESTQALSNILAPLMIFGTYLIFEKLNGKYFIFFSIILFSFAAVNICKTFSYSGGKIMLTDFEKELYNFSQKELQYKNWAYYSERYWSTFAYSGYIVSSPMLLPQNTIMPIEIAPVFDTSSVDFYKKKTQ